jgi:hypothetical protein
MSLQLDGRDGSARSMLAIEGLTKSFGAHRVLRDVVLSVSKESVEEEIASNARNFIIRRKQSCGCRKL